MAKTCEEYVIKRLEELEQENAKLIGQLAISKQWDEEFEREFKEDEKCTLDLPAGYEIEIEVGGLKYPIVLAHKIDDLYIWNFKECYKEMKCFGDDNKYDTSSIKKWLNEDLYNMLPEEVKQEIIECDGLGKVWLMSEYNVFGTSKFSNNNETILGNTHFDYFKNWHNRVKTILHSENYGDQEGWWYWLRSPRSGDSYHVVRVNEDGSENDYIATSNSYGVAPCFATKHILNLADVVRANSRERNDSHE